MIIQHFPGGRAYTGFLALRTKLKVLIRSPRGPAPATLSFLLTPLFLCRCTAALPVTPLYPAHPRPRPSRSGLSVSICLGVSIPLILRLCVPFQKCLSLVLPFLRFLVPFSLGFIPPLPSLLLRLLPLSLVHLSSRISGPSPPSPPPARDWSWAPPAVCTVSDQLPSLPPQARSSATARTWTG